MPINIGVRIKDNKMHDKLDRRVPEMMSKTIKYIAQSVWGEIGKEAPTDHGLLAGSYDLFQLGRFIWGIQSPVKYRWWVHEGTGIHGPHGQRIYPREAKALAFYWDAVGEFVFFRSVAGQKPNRFIDRAINTTRERVDEFARRASREVD